MPVTKKYPDEPREPAIHLVLDSRNDYNGQPDACTRSGRQLGMPTNRLCGWHAPRRLENHLVAGCTVGRSVQREGLRGVLRTTMPGLLAEASNVQFKTELVRNVRPWKGIDGLEIAVAGSVFVAPTVRHHLEPVRGEFS